MKSMQHEKVPEINGKSKNFEGRMMAKREIVKMHLKYVSFLICQNRHVRQTTRNVMRAQRSNIKEIGLKYELLKFHWNMYHFWQAGAETLRNITFGERSLEKQIGGAQQLVLRGHGIPLRLYALLMRQVLFLQE